MSRISTLHLYNAQIKSAEKLKALCQAFDILEKETFIRSGRYAFTDVFICPDIDLLPFYNSDDPTERLIGGLCIELHVKRYGKHYGKHSNPAYWNIVHPKKSFSKSK